MVKALSISGSQLSNLSWNLPRCSRKIRKRGCWNVATETKSTKCTNLYSQCRLKSIVNPNGLIKIAAEKNIIFKSIKQQTEDNLETGLVCHHDNDKQCIKSRYIGWYFQYQIEIRRGLAERKPISMLLLWISLGLGLVPLCSETNFYRTLVQYLSTLVTDHICKSEFVYLKVTKYVLFLQLKYRYFWWKVCRPQNRRMYIAL